MNAKQPPRLGMLVLQRLGPQNDALAGDLAEEYRAGRSVAWYWWQVLASVVVGATRELWTHKWLGVHVVAAYVGIQAFLGYVWRVIWFRTPLSSQVQEFSDSVWGPSDPLVNAPYRWISIVAALPVMTLAGWVLAKLSDRQRGAALLLNSVVLVALNVPRIGPGHWGTQYDVSRDGQLVYFIDRTLPSGPNGIEVVIGWRGLLK